MKNDILPPPVEPQRQQEPQQDPSPDAPSQIPSPSSILGDIFPNSSVEQPAISDQEAAPLPSKNKWNKYYNAIFIIVGAAILLSVSLFVWYLLALRPIAPGNPDRIQLAVAPGSSTSEIGVMLADKKIIRSKIAFDIYVRLNSVRGKLLAGTYSLSPAESTGQIVGHLTKGLAEQFDVTFYPGATLNIASTAADKTPSHRQVLQKLGYSDREIDEAFSTSYASEYPVLFTDKPASADLEGYIYGQTYKIASGSTVKQILRRTFAEYEKQIIDNDLIQAYEKQGLNLYQGLTLASIIQREVPSAADQKQVAQIFLKRYKAGGTLGSDVTYHYAADKAGVTRDHTLNSPYNTRKVAGLPPGPIASPGITALQAVAAPAPGDYEFFLSGDDDKTYYAHTQAEHEVNIANHCAYKCSLP